MHVRIMLEPPKMQTVKEKVKYCAGCGVVIKKKHPKYISSGKQYCGDCFMHLGDWD